MSTLRLRALRWGTVRLGTLRRHTVGVAALLAFGCLPLASAASGYEAQVTHVGDGDTVWVRPLYGGAARAVRIEGIDAPEICQPGGREARHALARLVSRQSVRIDASGQDDYGRTLGRVSVQGRDVGRSLVRQGQAWSYHFRGSKGPYAREESMARKARRGLWSGEAPQEPRAFRISHGPCGPQPGH